MLAMPRFAAPDAAGAVARAAAPAIRAGAAALRIGVLLPQPLLYPDMGRNFLAGMQLYLSQVAGRAAGRAVELVIREYGVVPSLALEKARQLVADAQVDFVAGTIKPDIAAGLHPLLHERQVPFIVSDVSADVPRAGQPSPYVFRNSLGHWQSSWALGRWAARNVGRSAFIAASFYESGYDAIYAFQLGFESVGGTIVKTHITHLPSGSDDLAPLMAQIGAARPNLVYAAYSGQQAVDFVRAYAAARKLKQIPLLGSGFLVDESLLPAQDRAALNVRTALPWAGSLGTLENRLFTRAYQAYTGRPADSFAVLGYDTSQMIVRAVNAVGGDTADFSALVRALGSTAFASPRGSLSMDPATLDITGPLYLREVRRVRGALRNTVVAALDAPPAQDERLAELRDSLKTGWRNAYLCV
jgi:branched-chain amino acid transport system substrate-binding protein